MQIHCFQMNRSPQLLEQMKCPQSTQQGTWYRKFSSKPHFHTSLLLYFHISEKKQTNIKTPKQTSKGSSQIPGLDQAAAFPWKLIFPIRLDFRCYNKRCSAKSAVRSEGGSGQGDNQWNPGEVKMIFSGSERSHHKMSMERCFPSCVDAVLRQKGGLNHGLTHWGD